MAKTLQHRRDTTSNLASVTGSIGEIFMDTTKNTLVVMDGSTAGGHPLALEGQGGGGAQGASGATGLTGATGAAGAAGATGPAGGGGGSYDQSLNTTDDVVFNSALVGDVSIIANTVSGLDSYGNADTLIVDGGLTVQYDTQVTATSTLVNGYTNAAYCYFTATTFESGQFQFSNSNDNGWPVQDLTTLAALQPGTVVNFTDLSTGQGNSSGSFTVVSSTGSTYYGSPIVTLIVSNIAVVSGTTGWVNGGSAISNVNWAWSTTTGSIVDVLDVTETGVDITGALTVNGQAITAGSGAAGATGPAGAAGATGPAGGGGGSYDQSLNTTDDVVFNSALVGDVSIVGNTVSGVDSYGVASDLILDGTVVYGGTTTQSPVNTSAVNKWLKVGVLTPTTVSNTSYQSFSTAAMMYTSGSFDQTALTLTIDAPGYPDLTAWLNDSSKNTAGINVGAVINNTLYNFILNTAFTESGGTWTATVNNNPVGGGGTQSVNYISLPTTTTGAGPDVTEYFYLPLYL